MLPKLCILCISCIRSISLLGSCRQTFTTLCAQCIVACWTRASHEGSFRKKTATEPSRSSKATTATQQYIQQQQQPAWLCAVIPCLIKQPASAEVLQRSLDIHKVSFMVYGANRGHQCLFCCRSMVKASLVCSLAIATTIIITVVIATVLTITIQYNNKIFYRQ